MTDHKTIIAQVTPDLEFDGAIAAAWLRTALAGSAEAFPAALADQGFDSVESYGLQNESINVWRHPTLGWLVDWWDTDSRVMLIMVYNIFTYAAFQAKWLAPMALKIMAADKALLKEGRSAHKALRREAASVTPDCDIPAHP